MFNNTRHSKLNNMHNKLRLRPFIIIYHQHSKLIILLDRMVINRVIDMVIDRVINKVVNWVINMTANCILVVNKPIMVVNITTMGVNKVVTFF